MGSTGEGDDGASDNKALLQQIITALQLLTKDRITKSASKLVNRAEDDEADSLSDGESESAGEAKRSPGALTHVLTLIGSFGHDPAKDYTFSQWFERNEEVLREHCRSDPERRQVVLRALGTDEYSRLRARTSPKAPKAIDYEGLVAVLKDMFGSRISRFR